MDVHTGGGGQVKVDACGRGGGVKKPVFCGRHKWTTPKYKAASHLPDRRELRTASRVGWRARLRIEPAPTLTLSIERR